MVVTQRPPCVQGSLRKWLLTPGVPGVPGALRSSPAKTPNYQHCWNMLVLSKVKKRVKIFEKAPTKYITMFFYLFKFKFSNSFRVLRIRNIHYVQSLHIWQICVPCPPQQGQTWATWSKFVRMGSLQVQIHVTSLSFTVPKHWKSSYFMIFMKSR